MSSVVQQNSNFVEFICIHVSDISTTKNDKFILRWVNIAIRTL